MGRTAAGRMINQDISLSTRVASLSPEALALFCLMIPHFNSHGKMMANPHVIKGTVCPLIDWLTVERVEASLLEISTKTNVKWWRDERGLYYLHSLNWKDHQSLREDRLGPDHLPDYPGENGTIPGQLPEYYGTNPAKGKGREEKIEGKVKDANEYKKPSSDSLRLSGILADLISDNNESNRAIQPQNRDKSVSRWAEDIDRMLRTDHRTPEEVEEVIHWCQGSTFWRSNILSGKKLRAQFDTLKLQMEGEGKSRKESSPFAGRRII